MRYGLPRHQASLFSSAQASSSQIYVVRHEPYTGPGGEGYAIRDFVCVCNLDRSVYRVWIILRLPAGAAVVVPSCGPGHRSYGHSPWVAGFSLRGLCTIGAVLYKLPPRWDVPQMRAPQVPPISSSSNRFAGTGRLQRVQSVLSQGPATAIIMSPASMGKDIPK